MDCRGAISEEDYTNDLNYIIHDKSSQQRGTNNTNFVSEIHNIAGGKFNAVMVVIPTDFPVPVRSYKKLIDELVLSTLFYCENYYFYSVFVFILF